MARPRHDPTRALLGPKKTIPYIGLIAQDPRWVEGWDNSSARFNRAKIFYEENKNKLPKDISYTEICMWTQVFKVSWKAYSPKEYVLKALNTGYEEQDGRDK